MESPPKSVKYHVQVVRLRFDVAMVEVQAFDDSDAERKAIKQAQRLSDFDWQLQPFDDAAYRPHAEAMIAEDELTGPEEVEDALAWNEIRYLLLKGDCGPEKAISSCSHGSRLKSRTCWPRTCAVTGSGRSKSLA